MDGFAQAQKGKMMDDLISRQATIDAFLTELTKRERKNLLHTWSTVEVKYFVVDMLEKSPSAQPEQQIPQMRGWVCPVCGRGLSPYTSVCPCNNGKGWEITC